MGATIYWRPTAGKQILEGVGAPQSLMKNLRRAFNRNMPMKLDDEDLEKLRGMEAMFNEDDEEKNPYTQIIRHIENNGQIVLEAEY